MKRLVVLIGVLALVMSGCGSDDGDSSSATTAAGGGGTYKIQVDGKTDAFVGEFATFVPSKFSVHPGDTVEFDLPTFSGVPHTVTLGTLVDKAVAKLTELGPEALPVAQEEAPEMLNLPDVFNHAPPDGPPVPNQSAAQPCYLATGIPPLSLKGGAPACPKVEQPAFDGKQAFYNSGMLAEDGDSWKMKLADDIAPGTYQMMCMIHRGAMTAAMTVTADSESIPNPAAVSAAGKTEFKELVAKVKPAAEAARKLPLDKAALGSGDPKIPNVVVAEMGPKEISVPVGGTVVWNEFAFHTLSFNATDADVGVVTKNADGSWAFAQKSGPPAGFTVPAEAGVFPPPANSKPLLVDLGSFDGTGFKSTGITGSVPPQFIAFKLKFTKAGTIPFRCLVHPDMKGEVKVG